MRSLPIAMTLVGFLAPVYATTLEKLSMEELVLKSTAIVRAKVGKGRGIVRGTDVYTGYSLNISETWKPGPNRVGGFVVPGGTEGGLRQEVAGAPKFDIGSEYVLFLWTGRSGLTQVMGLTQGVFEVHRSGTGEVEVNRPAAAEVMVDKTGSQVYDPAVSMKLSDLRAQVSRVMAAQSSMVGKLK